MNQQPQNLFIVDSAKEVLSQLMTVNQFRQECLEQVLTLESNVHHSTSKTSSAVLERTSMVKPLKEMDPAVTPTLACVKEHKPFLQKMGA